MISFILVLVCTLSCCFSSETRSLINEWSQEQLLLFSEAPSGSFVPGRQVSTGFLAQNAILKGQEVLRIPGSLILTPFDQNPSDYLLEGSLREEHFYLLTGMLLHNKFLSKNETLLGFFADESLALNPNAMSIQSANLSISYLQQVGYHSKPFRSHTFLEKDIKEMVDSNFYFLQIGRLPDEMLAESSIKKAIAVENTHSLTALSSWDYCLLRGLDKDSHTFERIGKYSEEDERVHSFKEKTQIKALFPFLIQLVRDRVVFYRNAPFRHYESQETREKEELLRIKGVSLEPNQILEISRAFDGFIAYEELLGKERAENIGNFIQYSQGYFSYIAPRNFQKGEVISFPYGALSNFELLDKFGFLDPMNPFETFEGTGHVWKLPSELAVEVLERMKIAKVTRSTHKENEETFTQVSFRFTFYPYQASHNCLGYSRVVAYHVIHHRNEFESEENIQNLFLGKGVSAKVEVMAYKYYLESVQMIKKRYKGSLKRTINTLRDLAGKERSQETGGNSVEVNFVEVALIQKMNIERHMLWASRKMLTKVWEETQETGAFEAFERGTITEENKREDTKGEKRRTEL